MTANTDTFMLVLTRDHIAMLSWKKGNPLWQSMEYISHKRSFFLIYFTFLQLFICILSLYVDTDCNFFECWSSTSCIRSHLEYCVLVWALKCNKTMDKLEQVPQKDNEQMTKEMGGDQTGYKE